MLQVSCADVENLLKETSPTDARSPCRDLASQATQPAVIDTVTIPAALSDPTTFDFVPVFKLDAVLAAQVHPLARSSPRNTARIPGVHLSSTPGSLTTAQKIDKDAAQLERKVRLLVLANYRSQSTTGNHDPGRALGHGGELSPPSFAS
ncbi:hypothetical protein EDB85DRAFT_2153047 [Lactarius pseudohatsudake]|nr:hypothetical protein EDB85DRAFT_2153047 [Lactarius pseudohatsudake]